MWSTSEYAAIVEQMTHEIEGELLAKDNRIPDTLYHYTDLNGLEGILGNRELWATHYRHLNDTSELSSGEELVRQVLTVLPDALTDDLARPLAMVVRDWYIEKPTIAIVEVFVTSFSLDGDFLPQWQAYGSDGYGYAIGFAIAPDSNGEIGGGLQCTLRGCLYDEREFQDRIRDLVTRAANAFALYYRTYMPSDEESRKLIVTEAAKSVMPYIVYEVIRFKNAHFATEHEWRLCLLSDPENLATCPRRARGTSQVPYQTIGFRPNDSTFRISEIVVGPCDAASRIATVEALVARHQIGNCRVTTSGIPYRGK